MTVAMLLGASCTVLLAFPAAAMCALLYRFPIPFFGYASGPAAVPDALRATAWYLGAGGVILLAVLGGLAGVAAHAVGRPDQRRVRRLSVAFAALAATLAALVLATLDRFIGEW